MATPDDTPPGATLACAPCRGTGTVISNLAATAQEVTCPWCEGGGVQLPGHDAQRARLAAADATQP
jgi:DnaJ-class molecular chaperone